MTHPEKYPSGKYAAVLALLILAGCEIRREEAEPEPPPEKSELYCESPMDSIACLEAHNLERRREEMVRQMQDEGLVE